MRHFGAVLIGLFLHSMVASAALVRKSPARAYPPSVDSLSPGSMVVPTISWVGTFKEGQEKVNLTGTSFEDIDTQAKAIDSGYTIFSGKTLSSNATPASFSHVHCDDLNGEKRADYWFIVDGINYLRGISGDCHMSPGPDVCSRVSCSYNSAIYYCNQNSHDIYVPCATLGDYAAQVIYTPDCWHTVFTSGRSVRGTWLKMATSVQKRL